MADQTNTLYVVIDPSGAVSGANRTVNAINSVVNAGNNLRVTINQINRDTGNSANQINRHFESIRSTLNSLVAVAGTVVSIKMFESFIGEIQRVDRIYNGFIAMMNVTTGDTAKSAKEYEYLTATARAYGVSLESLVKSYAKLAASTKTVLTESQNKRLFESITMVSTVLHAESYTVERMFNALIQIASKGQVHMEELKQQLGEHLPGALAIAATAMNMSMKDMIKDIGDGKISAQRLLSSLPDELAKRFAGAAEVASKSLHSTMNRLKTSWFDAFKEMSTNGLALGLSAVIIEIDKHLQEGSSTFETFGRVAGEGFVKIAKFIAALTPEDIERFGGYLVSATEAMVQLAGHTITAVGWLAAHKEEVVLVAGVYLTYKAAVLLSAAATDLATAATTRATVATSLFGAVFGTVAAGLIGWQIGSYLREEFAEVEQAGIMIAARMTKLPVEITYGFERMSLEVPLFFHRMFENITNSIFEFFAWVQNLGPKAVAFLGFDSGELVKPMKFDFTSGLEDELSKLKGKYAKTIGEINGIYRDLYVEAGSRKRGKEEGPDPLSYLGLTEEGIKESQSLLQRFMQHKNDAIEAVGEDGNGKGDDKAKAKAQAKAAKEAVQEFKEMNRLAIETAKNGVDELQGQYAMFEEQLKFALDGGLITSQQFYQEQIEMSSKYVEASKQLLRDSIDFNADPVARERINGEILEIERKHQENTAKILRDAANDRSKFAQAVEKAEIDAGIKRLSEQEKFMISWRDNEGRLLQEAQMNGDTETVDRLMEVFRQKYSQIGDFWAEWKRHAEENLLDFDKMAEEVINNTTSKFGSMFEQVIFDSENAGDAVRNFADGMARSIVNALGQMLAQWLMYKAVQAMGIGNESAAAATAQSLFASAKVAEAGLNAFTATAAIPIVGPAIAPAAAATAMGFAAPLAATVTSLAGSAAAASFAGAFDEGGHIPANKWGVVGEYGPEIINGPANVTSRKDTAELLGNSSKNITINQTFNVQSDGDGSGQGGNAELVMQLRREMKSAVMEVIIDEKRPGGALS